MQINKKNRRNSFPEINTSALPDIIFMLLFFFMVVTVLREDDVKLKYDLPKVTFDNNLKEKSKITTIYLGKASSDSDDLYHYQMNDKISTIASLGKDLRQLKANIAYDQKIHLKIDKEVPMKWVNALKKELQKNGLHKVVFIIQKTPIAAL